MSMEETVDCKRPQGQTGKARDCRDPDPCGFDFGETGRWRDDAGSVGGPSSSDGGGDTGRAGPGGDRYRGLINSM